MKLHSLPIFAGLALLLTACDSKENKEPVIPETDFSDVAVRIEPIITKVTETDFQSGDAIGLTITREAGVHASNEKLTYDGTAFTGSLKWYAEGADKSTLAAYYPYADAVPTSFTVAADQSTEAALSASDFVSAVKADVLPSANAISMAFKHQLSRIVITVVNNSGSAIEGITLKGAVPTAAIAADLTATAAEGVAPVDIKTGLSGEKYYAILPPQTVSLKAAVSYAGLEREQNLAEADLVAGKQYSISIIVVTVICIILGPILQAFNIIYLEILQYVLIPDFYKDRPYLSITLPITFAVVLSVFFISCSVFCKATTHSSDDDESENDSEERFMRDETEGRSFCEFEPYLSTYLDAHPLYNPYPKHTIADIAPLPEVRSVAYDFYQPPDIPIPRTRWKKVSSLPSHPMKRFRDLFLSSLLSSLLRPPDPESFTKQAEEMRDAIPLAGQVTHASDQAITLPVQQLVSLINLDIRPFLFSARAESKKAV